MRIDATMHSLFGASKVAADVLVQEYGRYFGMPTVCFRGGCLTGPNHSGAELHGFLAYLARAVPRGIARTAIFGYKGKQVRDNIHSYDVCTAIVAFAEQPAPGGGLQPRRRPREQRLDARGDRALRGAAAAARSSASTSTRPGAATTSATSATSRRFRADYPGLGADPLARLGLRGARRRAQRRPRRVKVALVVGGGVPNPTAGGATLTTWTIVGYLLDRRHDVVVFPLVGSEYIDPTGATFEQRVERLEQLGATVTPLESKAGSERDGLSTSPRARLRRWFDPPERLLYPTLADRETVAGGARAGGTRRRPRLPLGRARRARRRARRAEARRRRRPLAPPASLPLASGAPETALAIGAHARPPSGACCGSSPR